jgi:peptide/nickel transport system substrate-binding protein
MKRTRRWLPAAAGLAAAAVLLAACSSGPASTGTTGSSGSLTVTGNTPGPIPESFSPFSLTSGGQLIDAEPMIYESLLQFDDLEPGTNYPMLASSYQFSDGDKTLTFSIRNGVKWTDGQPLTSADVVYTFDVIKKYPQLNINSANFQTVKADGPGKVVFTFAAADYTQLYKIGITYIVPEHIWKNVNPVKFTDASPVGTGPYVVKSFSPQQLTLTRNTHYWQPGKPAVGQLIYPAYDTADSANLALSEGQVTWAGNYIPNVEKTYISPDPTYRHYWFAPLGGVALIPNLTVYPLNSLDVREAISDAINRSTISTEGESGYEAPFTSPTGLVLPNDQALMAPQYASLRYQVNIAKAKSLLRAAGLTMGSGGYFTGKNGKPITLTIVDPSSYADYITDGQIIAGELKAIGLQVNVSGVSVGAWTADMADGDFQLTILYSNDGPSPYYTYQGWLDDSLTAPVGTSATGDYERWKDPATEQALASYTGGLTAAQRDAGIQALEGIMVKDEPVIPLVYSAVWFQYDNQTWTGWPTPSDPYTLGEPAGQEAELVVLHLSKR